MSTKERVLFLTLQNYLIYNKDMKLSIRSPSGDKFDVEADENITVMEFKELIAKTSNIPAPQQRLIYRGRVLKDPECDHPSFDL